MTNQQLFVWRGSHLVDAHVEITDPSGRCDERFYGNGRFPPPDHSFGQCAYCHTTCHQAVETEPRKKQEVRRSTTRYECGVCGFWESRETSFLREDSGREEDWKHMWYTATLQQLDLNSAAVGLSELCSHLKRRVSDFDTISPVRFEQLVEGIYKDKGYSTKLTASSRDGEYDILLLEKGSGEQIAVECKRVPRERKVEVGIVLAVLGVQLISGFRSAKIVTASTFTQPAGEEQRRAVEKGSFELELVDIERLTRSLGCYNVQLPPLGEWLKHLREDSGMV